MFEKKVYSTVQWSFSREICSSWFVELFRSSVSC